jgi:hypothetical protein
MESRCLFLVSFPRLANKVLLSKLHDGATMDIRLWQDGYLIKDSTWVKSDWSDKKKKTMESIIVRVANCS